MTRKPMGRDVEFPCPGTMDCWGASLVVLEQCMQLNLILLVQDLQECRIALVLVTRLIIHHTAFHNSGRPVHVSDEAWDDQLG
jgi:hypothetical protein